MGFTPEKQELPQQACKNNCLAFFPHFFIDYFFKKMIYLGFDNDTLVLNTQMYHLDPRYLLFNLLVAYKIF